MSVEVAYHSVCVLYREMPESNVRQWELVGVFERGSDAVRAAKRASKVPAVEAACVALWNCRDGFYDPSGFIDGKSAMLVGSASPGWQVRQPALCMEIVGAAATMYSHCCNIYVVPPWHAELLPLFPPGKPMSPV